MYELQLQFLGAFLILCTWSSLYRRTRWFRIAESWLVGAQLAVYLSGAIDKINTVVVTPLFITRTKIDSLSLWLTLILGILYIIRIYSPWRWISRYTITLLAGIGVGTTLKTIVGSQMIAMLTQASFLDASPEVAISNIIIAVTTFTTLSYFLFTFKHKGLLKIPADIGRLSLMLCFGTVMGGYLLTMAAYPVNAASEIVKFPSIYLLIPFVALIGVDYILRARKKAVIKI